MNIVIDMNLSPRWVNVLSRAGFAVRHWSDVGAATASDETIMAYARVNSCVVLTHDLDFSSILAATHGTKPSVVQIRAVDVNPDVIGNKVISALRQVQVELEEGALLTIDTGRTRIRLLPLLLD